jgi:hypothetical protein
VIRGCFGLGLHGRKISYTDRPLLVDNIISEVALHIGDNRFKR